MSKSAKKAAVSKPAPAPKAAPKAKAAVSTKATAPKKAGPTAEETLRVQRHQEQYKSTEPEGDRSVIIDGKGTIPIVTNGAMRRIARGEPVSVSEAELATIEASGVAFKRG